MKKLCLSIILLCYCILHVAAQQVVAVKGKILDKKLVPLANIRLQISDAPPIFTDSTGAFTAQLTIGIHDVVIKSMAHEPFQTQINVTLNLSPLQFLLTDRTTTLEEVEISTGYQKIPKERATGSFGFIGKEVLDRVVSTNITDRLQHNVAGLIFNKDASVANGSSPISIRGQSTLFANTRPLVVLNNFAYEGDLSSINPNDVASITILKDAAAASIWGARAGNGVIVITTKSSNYNQPIQVKFNSNFTIAAKPDLFYQSKMNSAAYVEVEQQLFARGYYQGKEAPGFNTVLSPVVELLIAKRDGKITASAADAAIAKYASLDNRTDIDRYLYQKAFNQQYSLSLNGGGAKQHFLLSLGYDKNATSMVGNNYARFTINLNNNFTLLNDKLEVRTGFAFNRANTQNNNPGTFGLTLDNIALPYLMLTDENGNGVGIDQYRKQFSIESTQKGLLNWQYNTLQELATADNTTIETGYRMDAGLKYKINKVVNLDLGYQYYAQASDKENLQGLESFFVRNQINRLTVVNADGSFTRPVPLGSILDENVTQTNAQTFRGQFNVNKDWIDHQITAIAGYEIRQQVYETRNQRYYGFDAEHQTSKIVDYLRIDFPLFYAPGNTGSIPNEDSQRYLTDRYISWFANFAYTYKNRYVLTGSARLDRSNLFGVNTNQKGVPLYALGAAWIISEAGFYQLNWLPTLKLRATYGYNGNIDKTLSAYTTARYSTGAAGTNLPFATIQNPPNPELSWERVRVINVGVDFATAKNRLSGSIEYYQKNGYNLIGDSPAAPAVGIFNFRGNNANTSGNGIDVTLNTMNLNAKFKWATTTLFSYGTDKVTKYLAVARTVFAAAPTVGKSLYAVWAYPSAGLDAQTGDPQGYLNGAVSKDYAKMIAEAKVENMLYMGSRRPKYFGAVRNTFSYGSFEVSANISYRLGYVFRRNSIRYINSLTGAMDNGLASGHGDYQLRWQKPGDEQFTNVPSISATATANRDAFYANSEVLVEKADHIRLEDITLSYNTKGIKGWKTPFNAISFYVYANNLGILWKATKTDLDPDYATASFVPVKTIAIGAKLNF